MKSQIYFSVTKNCNLSCNHCFQSASPNRRDTTISKDNFIKVIDNFPKHEVGLILTGGEVYSIKNQFYDFLRIINKSNDSRKEKIETTVQTNASWATSSKRIEKVLGELQEFGVKELDVTSNDEWHYAQGIKEENLDLIEKINEREKYLEDIYMRGAGETHKIFPKGRGKNIALKENMMINYTYCENSLYTGNVNINPKGEVYMCCFGIYRLPGKIINNPLEKILKKGFNDRVLNGLNNGGIKEVAKIKGMKAKKIKKEVERHGNCGLCAKLNGLI